MRNLQTKLILVIITLMMLAVFSPAPVRGQIEPPKGIPNLDLIILVDESETMWNKSDPEGVRVNTVNYLIDILASFQCLLNPLFNNP